MERARDWLKDAEAQLQAARHLLAGGDWSWCCFTCHQVAERALKAVCERLKVPRRGHNLNLLLQPINAHQALPDTVRQAAGRLNLYYTPTRYPNAFDEGAAAEQFFEEQARDALADAEEIYRFAEGIVGPP